MIIRSQALLLVALKTEGMKSIVELSNFHYIAITLVDSVVVYVLYTQVLQALYEFNRLKLSM